VPPDDVPPDDVPPDDVPPDGCSPGQLENDEGKCLSNEEPVEEFKPPGTPRPPIPPGIDLPTLGAMMATLAVGSVIGIHLIKKGKKKIHEFSKVETRGGIEE
jgi:hypothetical protein